MPMRTYNPVTKRYENDAPKNNNEPNAQPINTPIQSTGAMQAHIRTLEAKLVTIGTCTNIKQVKAILA